MAARHIAIRQFASGTTADASATATAAPFSTLNTASNTMQCDAAKRLVAAFATDSPEMRVGVLPRVSPRFSKFQNTNNL